MREFSTNKYGPWRRCNVETVLIGDRLACDYSQWELFTELKKRKTPRIGETCVGKDEMIFLFWLAQEEAREAKRAEAAAQ